MSALRFATLLAVTAATTACQTLPSKVALTREQQDSLTSYVQIYDSCVAQAAATIDDGESETVRIAGMALAYCEPERQDVSTFLDSTSLSSSEKSRFIRSLLNGATDQSTMIVRHLRNGTPERWPGSLEA